MCHGFKSPSVVARSWLVNKHPLRDYQRTADEGVFVKKSLISIARVFVFGVLISGCAERKVDQAEAGKKEIKVLCLEMDAESKKENTKEIVFTKEDQEHQAEGAAVKDIAVHGHFRYALGYFKVNTPMPISLYKFHAKSGKTIMRIAFSEGELYLNDIEGKTSIQCEIEK
jgi:hypothetical protein